MALPTTALDTVRGELRRKLLDLRGAPGFTDALAERERALGLHIPSIPSHEASAHEAPAVARAGVSGDTSSTPESPRHDSWGNEILDTPGLLGQYRVESARDGRVLSICGEASSRKHLFAWEYNAGERRHVCQVCFPTLLTTLKGSPQ